MDQMEGRLVVRMEAQMVDRKVVRKVAQKEGRLVDQTEVRTVDRSVGLKVAPKEGLMAVRLVGPQDLSEVRAALHRFAQLVPVPVQARLPVLRAMVVLGLEVVFA